MEVDEQGLATKCVLLVMREHAGQIHENVCSHIEAVELL